MKRIRVIPVLLLKQRRLVKTVKFKKETYIGDPINAVKIFNDKEVDELVLLDIDATKEKREPSYDLIKEIASECFMPFAYGGGINNPEQVSKILGLGSEKVIINSAAFFNPSLISSASGKFGSQSIVVAIDVKKNLFGNKKVFVNSGNKNTGIGPAEYARRAEELGAGEIILTSIDLEGTYQGYDIDLINEVSSAVSIPVVANGGAGKIQDFTRAVVEGKASALAAGSLFVYHGKERGILINFPSQAVLLENLYSKI